MAINMSFNLSMLSIKVNSVACFRDVLYELFDGEGNHVSSHYCNDDLDCDFADEDTWEED